MPKYLFEREDLTTVGEVRPMIDRAPHPWIKGLIALLYVFGPRISEAMNLKRKNLWIEGDELCIQIGILKRRDKPKGPYKTVPHILKASLKSPFMDVLTRYLERFKDPESRIFPFSRVHAWNQLKKLNAKISPHVFRHDRLMKLALKDASAFVLMDWAGWSSIAPAIYYIQASGRLAHKFKDRID